MSKTKQPPLDIDSLTEAAECLKAIAHPHRLQIIQLLLSGKQLSVGEVAEHCQLQQPATSEHLRFMQRCGFLESKREGRVVFYSVSEPHLKELMGCIQKRFGSKSK